MTWWRRLTGRGRHEAQLDAELRDHVERQVADYVQAGMSEPDARRRTRIELGGLDQVKDRCRDVRATRPIEELARDVRYACRVLRKSPGFTIAAITSLALGIGANTAIFSLIDAAMLKSLPVREPERLIELLTNRGEGPAVQLVLRTRALVFPRSHDHAGRRHRQPRDPVFSWSWTTRRRSSPGVNTSRGTSSRCSAYEPP